MIEDLLNLDPAPVVVPMTPPPNYNSTDFDDWKTALHVINDVLPWIVPEIANEYNLEVVDVYGLFGGSAMNHLEWMCDDNVHVIDPGHEHIASTLKRHVLHLTEGA